MATARATYEITTKDKSTAVINKVKNGFTDLTKTVFSAKTAFAAAAGAAGIGAIVAASNKSIDALAKQADAIGVSTDKLAGLQFAAGQTAGITDQKLNKAIQTMTLRVSEATTGTGLAVDALQDLGISANELNLLDPAEQMRVIADEFQNVENQADRVRIAYELFGTQGIKLANTLRVGSEGLDEFQQKAELLGIAINRIDAAKVEAANDSFDSASKTLEGFGNQLSVEVAPFITAIANSFTDAAIEAGGFGQIATGMVDGVVNGIGFIIDSVHNVRIAFAGVQVIVATLADNAIQSFADIGRAAVDLANAIPGIDIDFNETFIGQLADTSELRINELKQQLNELANQPAPSLAFKERVAEARAELQLAAEETAALNEAAAGIVGGDTEEEAGISDKEKEKRQKAFEALEEKFKTEEQLLAESKARELEIIAAAEQANIDTIIPFKDLRQKVEEKHSMKLAQLNRKKLLDEKKTLQQILNSNVDAETKKNQIAELSTKSRNQFAVDSARSALSSLSQINESAFKANKALGIAEAVISTAKGASNALGSVPFPANIAAAGSVIASGLVQINTIKSQQFSGGGGSVSRPSPAAIPSISSIAETRDTAAAEETLSLLDEDTAAVTRAGPAARPAPLQVSVNIEDDAFFSGREVRNLINRINDEVDQGAELRTA